MLAKLTAQRLRIGAALDNRLQSLADIPPPPLFLRIEQSWALSVAMQSAVCVSFAVHLLVIIGVGFIGIDPRSFAPPQNALDVVLVNAKSKSRPHKADALAQANLDGGGNTDEARRAKTPLPAIEQTASSRAAAQQDLVRQLERELKTLMTQAQSSAKVNSSNNAAPAPQQAAEMVQRSIEIAKLEAQISRDFSAYQQRPRRKFVGARAAEYRFAHYVDSWRQKIERIGNLNYPERARQKKIYGTLQLTVAIRADGEVENVTIETSSGSKILDDAAKRIVRLAAPFDRFPEAVARDTDVLHITRTWIFAPGNTVSTE